MTGIQATAVMNTKVFVERRFGTARWRSLLEKVAPATRALFDRSLKTSDWVDYDQVVDLMRAVATLEERDVLVSLGMHNSEANLRVTQRLVMKILSVQWVLRMAAFLWAGRVRDGGTLTVAPVEKGRVKVTLGGFPKPEPEWLQYLVGWFRRTVELSGGRDVRVALEGGGTKPYEPATYDVRWE